MPTSHLFSLARPTKGFLPGAARLRHGLLAIPHSPRTVLNRAQSTNQRTGLSRSISTVRKTSTAETLNVDVETYTAQRSGVEARAPLPPPPKAPKYPCPWLTVEEVKTYLDPLTTSRQWTAVVSEHDGKTVRELSKNFPFPSQEGHKLEQFLQQVKEVESRQKHHAVTTVHLENGWNVAHVRVHTHTALRPSDFPDESLEARAHPGITLRDVRFAYALENLVESTS